MLRPGIFVEVDLSIAEDRVCRMWTRAPRQIEIARMHPSQFDEHRYTASQLFGIPESEVDKDLPKGQKGQRFLAKTTNHGAQRQMSGQKLSDKFLVEHDLVIAPNKCQSMLNKYLSENFEIRDIFFLEIRNEIMMKRELRNPFGARWRVPYGTLDDDIYRRAYSFPMQSTIAQIMNLWGFLPTYHYLKSMRSKINLQRHDAIIVSCHPHEAYDVACFILRSVERPVVYPGGNEMIVWGTIKIGRNDKEGYEWKALPTKAQFEEVMWNIIEKDDARLRLAA